MCLCLLPTQDEVVFFAANQNAQACARTGGHRLYSDEPTYESGVRHYIIDVRHSISYSGWGHSKRSPENDCDFALGLFPILVTICPAL